ncbi:AEC family transporter [Thermoclostridium stercorarium]|nr:AEC family transporter [Thermoclostridium stercorarium]
MNFDIVFDQVLILLIIMVAGVIAGKAGIIADGASKKFSELLLYVTSPMLVLGSFFFEYSAEKFINGLMVFLIATVFYFFSIFLSSILFKGFDEKIKPIMRFSSVFSNAGFIGLPMMKALYGQDGVFLGSFYIVAFNLFVWTFGYTMYGEAKKGDGIKSLMKKALLNP